MSSRGLRRLADYMSKLASQIWYAMRACRIVAVLLFASLGCNSDAAPSRETISNHEGYSVLVSEEYPDLSIGTHARVLEFSNKELSLRSDLVVVGKAVDKRDVEKSFVKEFQNPDKKGETLNATFVQHISILSFQVDEYFKGTGPSTIRVAVFDNSKHPSYPAIEHEQPYVLYLYHPQTQENRQFFENAYTITATGQGVWKVRGDKAVQQFRYGRSIELSDFRN